MSSRSRIARTMSGSREAGVNVKRHLEIVFFFNFIYLLEREREREK